MGKNLLSPSQRETLSVGSGLSDEMIDEMGLYTVLPSDLAKIGLPPKVNSALAIPYPGSDSIRYRCDYVNGDKGPKY